MHTLLLFNLLKVENLVRSITAPDTRFAGEEAEPPQLCLRGLSLSSTSRRSQVSSAPFHYRVIILLMCNNLRETNQDKNLDIMSSSLRTRFSFNKLSWDRDSFGQHAWFLNFFN